MVKHLPEASQTVNNLPSGDLLKRTCSMGSISELRHFSDRGLIWSRPFVNIDYEIISMVILPLLPIEEGHLSVTDKSICTKYWLIT